ncbi:MAG: winged helix-turn-helix domain-containing protein, partial [Dehalococcoidia bacterium]|nr:winged helix-turn-helix domain-containing protein [Dehalococcoidia bacterium]
GADFFAWHIDHWYEGLPLLPLGIALIPAAFHGMNGAAVLCREMARALLGGGAGEPSSSESAIERAASAAVQWQGLHLGRPANVADARAQALQLKVFGAHLLVFAAIAVIFAILNGLTTPDNWWSLYVTWAFAMPLALHAGYLLRGLVGAHAGLFLVTNIGLFVIDAVYSESTWFYWVLLGWGPLLAIHAVIDQRLRARGTAVPGPRPEQEQEQIRLRPAPELAETESPGSAQVKPRDIIQIDVEMRRVTVDGERVELTPKEFELLALLARHPGRPFSRDELLDRIWSNDYEVTDRTVDTHVLRLRKKLGGHAEVIETVWGIGYRFQEE